MEEGNLLALLWQSFKKDTPNMKLVKSGNFKIGLQLLLELRIRTVELKLFS